MKVLTSFTDMFPPLNDEGAVIFMEDTLPVEFREMTKEIEVLVFNGVEVMFRSPSAETTTLSAETT